MQQLRCRMRAPSGGCAGWLTQTYMTLRLVSLAYVSSIADWLTDCPIASGMRACRTYTHDASDSATYVHTHIYTHTHTHTRNTHTHTSGTPQKAMMRFDGGADPDEGCSDSVQHATGPGACPRLSHDVCAAKKLRHPIIANGCGFTKHETYTSCSIPVGVSLTRLRLRWWRTAGPAVPALLKQR